MVNVFEMSFFVVNVTTGRWVFLILEVESISDYSVATLILPIRHQSKRHLGNEYLNIDKRKWMNLLSLPDGRLEALEIFISSQDYDCEVNLSYLVLRLQVEL